MWLPQMKGILQSKQDDNKSMNHRYWVSRGQAGTFLFDRWRRRLSDVTVRLETTAFQESLDVFLRFRANLGVFDIHLVFVHLHN